MHDVNASRSAPGGYAKARFYWFACRATRPFAKVNASPSLGKANHRVAVKAAKRRRFTAEMWALAKDRLAKGWTFEQIHGRCRRDGIAMVCAETLYKEYYRRQKLVMAGKSHEVLPPLPKRQKKRKTRDRNAKKCRNAGRD